MQKTYARIIDNTALDVWVAPVVGLTPADAFHHDIADQFIPVPSDVTIGSSYDHETDTWTPAPIPEPTPMPEPVTPAEIRRAEIEAELTSIDAASARPLRAILAATVGGGTADAADIAKLRSLEDQATALRSELVTLTD